MDTAKLRELAQAAYDDLDEDLETTAIWDRYHKATHPSEILALLDTLEQYRADAERYRWIREQSHAEGRVCIDVIVDPAQQDWGNSTIIRESHELDAAIDRARSDTE